MLVNKEKVLENGTMIGAVVSGCGPSGQLASRASEAGRQALVIPEIVISASYSSHSLNQNHCDMMAPHCSSLNASCSSATSSSSNRSRNSACHNSEPAAERIALLRQNQNDIDDEHDVGDERDPVQQQQQQHHHHQQQQQQHDAEFEQFILNRTTSESNMLESSIYSELQFPPSINGEGGNGTAMALTTAAVAAASSHTPIADMLNSSACSRSTDSSRQSKRMRRTKTHKSSKVKCSSASATVASAVAQPPTPVVGNTYPPQYTAIFLEGHHGSAANAMGQLASAAASSPFLPAPVPADPTYMQHHHQHHLHHQQYQYYQQRPMLSTLAHHHQYRRNFLEATVPLAGTETSAASTNVGQNFNANDAENANVRQAGVVAAAAAALNTQVSSTDIRKWFSRPSLPFVIGVLALLGVACTLGGIVLGSTGLIEHSTQYLSAALLMIGIGVSLLVISGVIWRLSLPDDVDDCPCFRHLETCRSCNSPYCANRLMAGSYLYPEFQHRPPPPSYLTSLNECTAMGFLLHPTAANMQHPSGYSNVRLNTPPPLYRSTNSLNAFVPMPTNSVTANANASSAILSPALPEAQNALQPITKEINYLDLD